MDLSVTIIARDAARSLSGCLKSTRGIAFEVVVVVDDRTTDETALIAKSFGARVFTRKFTNFSDQKNFAIEKARGDWILALDADEQISLNLANEIKQELPTSKFSAYYISRLNTIFGKAIQHTNWEPKSDTHIWLWRKNSGRWVGSVHEEVLVKGKIGKLQGFKLHSNYTTVEEFISKMNDYTSKETQAVNPIFDFGRRYLWHGGWLDGWHGLFLSYLQAVYHVVTWVKLWEKKNSR